MAAIEDRLQQFAVVLGEEIWTAREVDGDLLFWIDELSLYEAATTGCSLYDGSAGVALCFLELWRLTGEDRWASRAQATARDAVTRSAQSDFSHGLYSGTVGVAVAAAGVGRALGSNELQDVSRRLIARTLDGPIEGDLVSGSAGSHVGRALARAQLGEDMSLPARTEELRCAADRLASDRGDVAHGSAGIHAFLRANSSWLEEALGRLPGPPLGWCHGEAGVVSVALAAGVPEAVFHVPRLVGELARRERWPSDDTLCHGLFGTCSAIASVGRRLGDEGVVGTAVMAAADRARVCATTEIVLDEDRCWRWTLFSGAAGVAWAIASLLAEPVVPLLTLH